VDSVTREIRELEGCGVTFFDYDLPELKTTSHVAVMGTEKAAWFADTACNILCLHENPGEPPPKPWRHAL
jgi:hypothetical protein